MGSGNSRMEEVAPVRRTKRRSVASFFCGGAAAAAAADDAADSSEIETRLQEDPVRNQVAANFSKSSTKELQNSHSERASNQPSTSSDSADRLTTGDLHSSEISENYSYPSSILPTPIQEHSGRTVINTEAEGISENEPNQTEETSSLNNRSTNNNINNNTNNSSNRRSIWETFSRHGSRRNSNNNNSNNNNNETSDGDELAFYDRWLDLGDEIFGDSIGDELRSSRRRRHASSALNWQSRSLIRERGGRVGSNSSERRRNNNTPFCPNGLHPDGMCACTVFSSAEASISRIVMLTEALFEVLDEIHRHPTSLSLSSTSHQAPESVVNSLPLKTHKKSDKIRCNDDVEQCYICLTEYEEGEKIRVLPCNHEFHMSCVDKWLKEVHRVCPLCRGDVCENTSQSFS